MGVENINRMFQPKSIAVVGASEKPGTIGNSLMRNLIKSEFAGTVYPVNPNHKTIWKHHAYPSIQDIKAPIDLVVISTPIVTAPQIIRGCVDSKAGEVVLISAGIPSPLRVCTTDFSDTKSIFLTACWQGLPR